MKIYGLTPQQIKSALSPLGCTVQVQKQLPTSVQCLVQAPKPHVFNGCVKTQTSVLKALWDAGATKQVLNKCIVKKGWFGTKALGKAKSKGCVGCKQTVTSLCVVCKNSFVPKVEGGYSHCHSCHKPMGYGIPNCAPCQDMLDKPIPPTIPPAKPHTPKSTLPSIPILYDPIEGDSLTDGEPHIPTASRPIGSSVMGLYVLEELSNTLSLFLLSRGYLVSRGVWTDKVEDWRNETVWADHLDDKFPGTGWQVYQQVEAFWRYKHTYERTLARNLFDYLAVIALGEARHGRNVLFDGVSKRSAGRSSMFKGALTYDPRHFLPAVATAFEEGMYGGGYGGGSWGKICRAAAKYFQFKDMPIVFADHVVDLSHNGGVAFNKDIIFSRDMTDSAYIRMLDKKKEGSLLNSTLTLTLPWDVFMWVRRFQAHPYTFDMYTAQVKSEEDAAPISFIRWGEKVLSISLTQAPVSSPASEETALEGPRETYPRGARIIKSTPTFKVGETVVAKSTQAEFTITKVESKGGKPYYTGWWSKAGPLQEWTPDHTSINSYYGSRGWALKKPRKGVCTICATPMGPGHNFVNGDTNQGIIKPAHPFREGNTHGKA